jgi:hypothetical protein
MEELWYQQPFFFEQPTFAVNLSLRSIQVKLGIALMEGGVETVNERITPVRGCRKVQSTTLYTYSTWGQQAFAAVPETSNRII